MAQANITHAGVGKGCQSEDRHRIGIVEHPGLRAKLLGVGFNWAGIPENYSPTSYLVNTLLPKNNRYRTMDYVATVVMQ